MFGVMKKLYSYAQCMVKIFMGEGRRGGGWRGGSSERCFEWGGGWGSLRDLSKTS